jgi:leucyl aminopeptidase (aminopeptidase T)
MRRALLVAVVALASPPALAQAPAQLTLDFPAIAERIVRQLDLQPGEKVLLVAHPGLFEALVPQLRYAVVKAGGVDLGVMSVVPTPYPAAWDLAGRARAAPPARDALRAALRDVDAAVMMPGATPADPVYAAMQEVLREGRGRTVHFHWDGGGAPSAAALPGQPLPPRTTIDATYQRALLHTDYEVVAAMERRFEAALRSGETRLTTPLGTDLRFRIGDRPVNRQDGDASAARARRAAVLVDREIELPCGALRVAPLEETVEGWIAFPPSQWDGRPVEGLKLRFARGKVAEVTARSGQDAVMAEMQSAGEAGQAFRELGLGFNPELAVPERRPWIPYYGYGAGVVRLSLGDNRELGGAVKGDYVRWNFFTDATLTVGDVVWVKDGRLSAPR